MSTQLGIGNLDETGLMGSGASVAQKVGKDGRDKYSHAIKTREITVKDGLFGTGNHLIITTERRNDSLDNIKDSDK